MPAASSLGARAMTATSVPPEERRFSVATVWSQSTFNTLSTSGGTSARPSSTLCSGADTLVEKELSAVRGVPEGLHLRVPRRLVHPTVRPGLRRLLGWLAPRDAVLLLLPAFAASVCSSGVPVAMTHVVGRAFASFLAYDGSAPGELRRQVRVDACVLAGFALGVFLVRGAGSMLWACAGERAARRLRRDVFASVLRKDLAWFELGMGLGADVGAAGLMGAFVRDTDEVRIALGVSLGALVLQLGTMLTGIAFALARCWSLTLVILAALPIMVVATAIGEVLARSVLTDVRGDATQLSSIAETSAAAISTLKAFNAQTLFAQRFSQRVEHAARAWKRLSVIWGARMGLCSAVGLLTFVQGFGYGCHLVHRGKADPGAVMSTFLASLVAMGQLQAALLTLNQLERGKHAAASLAALVASYVQSDEGATEKGHDCAQSTRSCTSQSCKSEWLCGKPTPPPSALLSPLSSCPHKCSDLGELILRGVSMAYPTRPETPVLRDVHLYVPAGEHTYLLGPSGCGKSTVAALLLQLYAPQAGEILLDGHDLRTLDRAWCQRQIAGVTQTPFLLERTIAENVEMGAPRPVSRTETLAACEAMELGELLKSLPHGADTPVSHGGTDLSGGQRQRIALARARIRDPPVLVLDEATSALDAACAARVHAAIRAWRRGRTTLWITHRVEQVGMDDLVYWMDRGTVVEIGYRGVIERCAPESALATVFAQKGPTPPSSGGTYTPLPPYADCELLEEPDDLLNYLADLYAETDEGEGEHKQGAEGKSDEEAGTSGSPPAGAPKQGRQRRGLGARLRVHPRLRARAVRPRLSRPAVLDAMAFTWRTLPSRALLLVGLVICLASGLTTPVFSFFLTRLLLLVDGGAPSTLRAMVGTTAGVAVADGALKAVRFITMEAIATQWIASLRRSAFQRVVYQDRRWHDRPENAPARIANTLVKDAEDARAFVSQTIGQASVLLAMLLGSLAWAFVQGWLLTLCTLGLAPVLCAAFAVQGTLAVRCERRSKQQRQRAAERVYEVADALPAIRAMSLEDALTGDFAACTQTAYHAGVQAAFVTGLGAGIAEAMTYAAEALLYAVGAELLIAGMYDVSRFMMVINAVVFAVAFSSGLASTMPGASKCVQAILDLGRLLRLRREDASDAYGTCRRPLRGRLEVQHVSFAYGDAAPRALHDVSFSAAPGERVALVGRSGCGKSTVAALLQRLYEPTSGAILIDGHALQELDAAWVREHVAVVGQTPSLFPGTLEENVRLGASATHEDVVAAARRAHMDEFTATLPAQYRTEVGKATAQLSGGQVQRVAIARGLLRTSARVLILDEFTSALDGATSARVAEEVLGEKDGAPTRLVITHDPQLMRLCDRVVVLDGGRVVHEGSYKEAVAAGAVPDTL